MEKDSQLLYDLNSFLEVLMTTFEKNNLERVVEIKLVFLRQGSCLTTTYATKS